MINDDDDNNYDNANDDKGGQKITLFQIMHFREPLISEKPMKDVPISVYCLVIISLVFNNPCQSGLWIVQSKVSQEGIYTYYFDFFLYR